MQNCRSFLMCSFKLLIISDYALVASYSLAEDIEDFLNRNDNSQYNYNKLIKVN